MPELPEVETVRRRLAPFVERRRIAVAEIADTRLVGAADPRATEAGLRGRRIDELGRRGKYLLFHLDDGATLISHLRMTGNWFVSGDAGIPHVRARLVLDDDVTLVYTDARRFGTWDLLAAADAEDYLATRLGPEPLDPAFDGPLLRRLFRHRRAPVKALLLDQRLIAGVGNIYADEALHRAGIHPERPAGRLTGAQCADLAAAVRESLVEGIRQGGSSIRDFRDPVGGYGSMQETFRVYGRDGEPCPVCGTEIVKARSAGRGTHLCPVCQPRPRRRVRECVRHTAR